jgi:integral membrane protein
MTTTKNYSLLRRVGYAEAASYLILLLIAMPMKYGMGMEWAVKYTGWAHGILFMGYVGMVATEGMANKWPFKFYVYGFVAALLPFGPIVFDKKVLDRL